MDWVHCNNCFLIPDSQKCFYLTSCGHIYCEECEVQCARNQCKLCGNQCTTITLSSNMKPDVQLYFTDPGDLLKKKIKEVQQVAEFQKNHRARLMAHQKKQLKKFKTVKDDFRKLLKNLKDLDGERKKLAHENDMMKKFITMQRSVSHNPGSAERVARGVKSSFDFSPAPNTASVFSKLSDKSDKQKSQHNTSQRMCVITPPMNGKLGVIPNTPSPSTCLRKMTLSSNSNESFGKSPQYVTPNSTPGSMCDKFGSFVSPQSSASTIDPYSPGDYNQNVPYKRDVRKLVVHPYSPED